MKVIKDRADAEIIAIGSELVVGGREETNSLWLTRWLAARGIEVRFKGAVGDAPDDIAAAVKVALGRARLVLLTGGLGPTEDDCTRHAVALATRRRLRHSAEAWDGIRQRLAAWSRTPTAAQRRQALLPIGAHVLRNAVGSAPGFWMSGRGAVVAALPGVPIEAQTMLDGELAPVIARHGIGSASPIVQRQLHTFGLPEPEVDRLIKRIAGRRGVQIGVLAAPTGVNVTVTAIAGPGARRSAVVSADQAMRDLRACLSTHVYAEGEGTMERAVGRELLARKLMVAFAESCTGGLIAHRVTEVAGSSAYMERSAICYSNRAKEQMLGVPHRMIEKHGAVSRQVAAAMARGIRQRSGADVGIGVTGIAGPGGGTERKPVGLVYIGLDARRASDLRAARAVREFRFHGTRSMIKLRASQAALDLLRRWLQRLPLDRR